MTNKMNTITEREKYLRELAQNFGVPYHVVCDIADDMPNEDHDALVTTLEDYADDYDEYFNEWEFDDDF